MKVRTASIADYDEKRPETLTEVLCDELKHIRKKEVDEKNLESVFVKFHEEELSALCFSGGGIRSATFGLGIVQALAKHKLLSRFDYLSTVSGGGYLGSWLSAWIRREQLKFIDGSTDGKKNFTDEIAYHQYQENQSFGIAEVENQLGNHHPAKLSNPNHEPPELQHLRKFSNFLSPKAGLMSADTWTLIAIYLRNLFLNWTISIPLITAVLLLPKLFLSLNNLGVLGDKYLKFPASFVVVVSFLAGVVSIAYILYQLPGNKINRRNTELDDEAYVVSFGVFPMLLLAIGSTTLWAWVKLAENAKNPFAFHHFSFETLQINFSNSHEYPALWAAIGMITFGIVLGLLGGICYLIINFKHSWKNLKTSFWQISIVVLSGAVGGLVIWLAAFNLADYFPDFRFKMELYTTFAVPIYLLLFLAAATAFVGLASKYTEDADREWLARYGAWILIFCFIWIVGNALILFGPDLVGDLIKEFRNPQTNTWFDYVRTTIIPVVVPIVGAISGFISLFGGFSDKSPAQVEPADKSIKGIFFAYAPPIAGFVFLGFIFVGLAIITQFLMNRFNNFLIQSFEINYFSTNPLVYVLLWIVGLFAIGVFMAFFVNVNKFSLHAAYRDRLVRAYLGASKEKRNSDNFTNFDDKDNFQLHRLRGQKPFHIINATLNLIGGNNLAWQNRKGVSFTMSPLHCGSWNVGYRPSNKYCRNEKLGKCENIRYCNQSGSSCESIEKCQIEGKALRLGTAMAISGAAANPNMGYYSSPIVTFLLALFNIRLGWWLGNTGIKGGTKDFFDKEYYQKQCPTVAVLPLINETLGRTNETKRYINVTDGGHFENLALYEMVLRRCKFIVLSDGAADGKFNFGEISNAIEKCKVDLGVEIKFKKDFDLSKILPRKNAQEFEGNRLRFAVAQIIYPDIDKSGEKLEGTLLYIRPTFYGKEPTDIAYYAKANPTFPHQTTADEQYDEHQFEAYRSLGFFIMDGLIEKRKNNGLENFFNSIKGEVFEETKSPTANPTTSVRKKNQVKVGENDKQKL